MTTRDQVVTTQAQAMTTQANQWFGPQVNPNASTPASRIQEFMRIDPPTFHGTKVDEDPKGFIYEVFKVVDAVGVISRENAELATYQLKEVI